MAPDLGSGTKASPTLVAPTSKTAGMAKRQGRSLQQKVGLLRDINKYGPPGRGSAFIVPICRHSPIGRGASFRH